MAARPTVLDGELEITVALDVRGQGDCPQAPFLSPFMRLGRIATGAAQPWEILLSIALLVVSIGIALWLASLIYAAGVLLYGQRPGARALWHLVRVGM